MPISLQSDQLPLSKNDVERLWQKTITYCEHGDDQVNIRSVSEEEIQALNARYRGKDDPTNVLTFSYHSEHDIALCLSVAEGEAKERGVQVRDYVALLLVHGFLHATGMDHERTAGEAAQTLEAERAILRGAGFTDISL